MWWALRPRDKLENQEISFSYITTKFVTVKFPLCVHHPEPLQLNTKPDLQQLILNLFCQAQSPFLGILS